jgi:tRNA (cmo5U34)-methyltransferase
MSSEHVARGYDRLAALYDGMARLVYGNALRRAQTCMLSQLPANATILVLGGGSGWFLEQLVRRAQPRRVIYVELSGEMLARAQRRIAQNLPAALASIDFVVGRAEDAGRWGQVDVIVTHCLLDMYVQPALARLVGDLRQSLGPTGVWYFSDFQQVRAGFMQPISRGLIWLMYRFFRWQCKIEALNLPDFEAAFAASALAPIAEQHFYSGMIVARLYRLQD